MSDRPLVVLTDVTDLDPAPGLQLLNEHGFDTMVLSVGQEPIPPSASRAVAVLAGYAHLGEEFFQTLSHVRFVATASAGTDMVDAEAAGRRGVQVQPLVGAATEEVATHALALMLAIERGLPQAAAATSAGGWTNDLDWMPRRASTLTLGLLGAGRIGAALARLAQPLVERTIAHDPHLTEAPEGIDELVDLDELLTRVDVLSLHLPLTPQTAGILDTQRLSQIKPGLTLLNVSRGELLDVHALLEALSDGRVRGAGLDVLDGEPPAPDHPLRSHPRVLLTPHSGFMSASSMRSYELDPARAVISWWQGQC